MSAPGSDPHTARTVHAPPVPERQRRLVEGPIGGLDLAHPVAEPVALGRPESAAEEHVERLEQNAAILAAIRKELPLEALYHVTLRLVGAGELVVAGSVTSVAVKRQVEATCRNARGIDRVRSELEVA